MEEKMEPKLLYMRRGREIEGKEGTGENKNEAIYCVQVQIPYGYSHYVYVLGKIF